MKNHVRSALFASALAATLSIGHGQTAAADYTGKPYNGTPIVIPGTIQAEQYDIAPGAANDVTFHYNGKIAQTPHRTSPDSIGVAKFGNGHVSTTGQPEAPEQVYVGWTQPGEWLKYTVQIAQPGTYIFGGKLAAGNKGAKISATFTPVITTGAIEIPTTAGFRPGVEVYHVWETLDRLAEVRLPSGTYVMTIRIEGPTAGMNFDYFTFTKKL
jgi:hypothetical protein